MRSPILKSAATVLSPVILVVSLALLWRGHNLPGGGFIGGLTAAGAVLLHAFGHGSDASLRVLENPVRLMIVGLALGIASALPGWLMRGVFFASVWLPEFRLPLLGDIHLGTFLAFDVGVYLAVAGFVIHCARSLDEDYDAPNPLADQDGKDGSPWNS
jgi:multicomponent Na+:H+ antiporter subunit B